MDKGGNQNGRKRYLCYSLVYTKAIFITPLKNIFLVNLSKGFIWFSLYIKSDHLKQTLVFLFDHSIPHFLVLFLLLLLYLFFNSLRMVHTKNREFVCHKLFLLQHPAYFLAGLNSGSQPQHYWCFGMDNLFRSLSCALQDVYQYLWPLLIRYQKLWQTKLFQFVPLGEEGVYCSWLYSILCSV